MPPKQGASELSQDRAKHYTSVMDLSRGLNEYSGLFKIIVVIPGLRVLTIRR